LSLNAHQKQMLSMHFARKTVAKKSLLVDPRAVKVRRRIEEIEERKRLEKELFL